MLDSSMLRTIGFIAAAGITLSALLACGSDDKSEFGSGKSPDAGQTTGVFTPTDTPAPPPIECNKMDLVFVIDNSQSMVEEQQNLVVNFPNFIKVLNEYKTQKGEELDYRVAITSTDDVKDQGVFTKSRGLGPDQSCNPGPNLDPWLERSPDISSFFSCRAQLGTLGTNIERPLEAAYLALTARGPDGDGRNMKGGTVPFIRESALLGLIIITDEDEGSSDNGEATPSPARENVDEYTREFDAVKRYRGRWAAAVIAGDRACNSSTLGQAGDAKRLKQFVNTTGKNGVFRSICDGDLSQGLQAAIDTFTNACKGFPGVE